MTIGALLFFRWSRGELSEVGNREFVESEGASIDYLRAPSLNTKDIVPRLLSYVGSVFVRYETNCMIIGRMVL